jgi:DNA-binding transcriptional regulator GbsR (MarR family)
MDPLHEVKWQMIEAGGRTAQTFGLKRLLGQIFIFLYLSEESVNLDDMVEGLGVSKASMSIACRQLLGLGAIKKVWKKGDRRDYYQAETDLRKFLKHGLLDEFLKKLRSAEIQIEQCSEVLNDAEGVEAEQKAFMQERLCEAERYREKVQNLLDNPIVRNLF